MPVKHMHSFMYQVEKYQHGHQSHATIEQKINENLICILDGQ